MLHKALPQHLQSYSDLIALTQNISSATLRGRGGQHLSVFYVILKSKQIHRLGGSEVRVRSGENTFSSHSIRGEETDSIVFECT